MRISRTSINLMFCFFFGSVGLTNSNYTKAAFLCEASDASSAKNLLCSGLTETSLGTAPELELKFFARNSQTMPYEGLDNSIIPKEITLTQGSELKIEYLLANGLANALVGEVDVNGNVIRSESMPLPKGKFDKDGDPIDNTAVYQSIEWALIQSDGQKRIIEKTVDKDILLLDAMNCINGSKIEVTATPYTVTGEPKQGDPITVILQDASGNDYILSQCDKQISEDMVKVTILNKTRNTYLVDETNLNSTNKDARIGDELVAYIYLPVQDTASNTTTYEDVTEQFVETFVWGYQTNQGDALYFENGQQADFEEIIWMDGSQNVASGIYGIEADTTGKQEFKVQTTNNKARALHKVNQSEQSMKVIFKFGGNEMQKNN
ncbi:hypothetical protein [Thorsellia kenyensis]|uniref:Uncharacterized protein n=1 Tax=Thorsellia kenyensis TaxID=1549888 RepID=A0ABV6C923_9GAMM